MNDVSEILPGKLYQGAAPAEGPALANIGFDAVFLCAAQYQPPSSKFQGVHVYYCPMHDVEGPDLVELRRAEEASSAAARLILSGKRVLITCMRGLNRSALVTALTLIKLGMSPELAVATIQSRRPGSLFNRSFLAYLYS